LDEKLLQIAVQIAGPSTTKQLEGRDHAVFPAVLVREQVLVNNLGRTFLSAAEIEASVDAWNGVPVVIRHPSKRGMPVSARDPEVLNSRGTGRIFGARFEDGALKGDVWIDLQRAAEVADALSVVNGVQNGEVGEVSTGFGTQIEHAPGKWGTEAYDYVLHEIRPDHLALLPDEIGACSVTDGCGLGVNHAGDCSSALDAPKPADPIDFKRDAQWVAAIREAFNKALQAVGIARNEDTNDDGAPAPDDPPAGADGDTPEEGSSMNRDQMIAQLAGAGTDKDALAKLSDCQLKALCSASEPAPPANDSEALQLAHKYRRELEDLQAKTANALESEEKEKVRLLDDVIYNAKSCPWNETEVRKMGIAELRKVHQAMFPRAANYSGLGGPRAGVTEPVGTFDFVREDIFATSKEAN
jgi:hypothetical protein